MPTMQAGITPDQDPLSRIPMIGGAGAPSPAGAGPGGLPAQPQVLMNGGQTTSYAPVTQTPASSSGRQGDINTHDPGSIQGLSPTDYYQGPTWQELIGMGKNPGGKGFTTKMKKRAPGWLQDPKAFDQMMASINEILGSQGAVDPAVLQRGQADTEAGRAAGAQSIAGNAAMMHITPDDPRYMVMNQINNQTSNREGSERLRDYEILQEQRKRTDLATMNPIMSFMLQMLHPKSAGNIAPGASAASASPDWGAAAGGAGNALAAFLNSRG